MGRSKVYKYSVEMVERGARHSPAGWDCRRNGRPTLANLAKYVSDYVESCKPGGVNQHIGRAYGSPRIVSARIRRNLGPWVSETVVEWRPEVQPEPRPMFEII